MASLVPLTASVKNARTADWDMASRQLLVHARAEKTNKTYSSQLKSAMNDMLTAGETLPPSSGAIARMLRRRAARTAHPASMLSQTRSALHWYFEGMGLPSPMHTPEMRALLAALRSTETTAPVKHRRSFAAELPRVFQFLRQTAIAGEVEDDRSAIEQTIGARADAACAPAEGVAEDWLHQMDIKVLRARTLFLLTLYSFLRPGGTSVDMFYRDNVLFGTSTEENGAAKRAWVELQILGGKGDTNKQGYTTRVFEAIDKRLCPVEHLRAYLYRTEEQAALLATQEAEDGHNQPPAGAGGRGKKPTHAATKNRGRHRVFLTHKGPSRKLSSAAAARDIELVLKWSGVEGHTAAECRNTGASVAYNSGVAIEDVLQIGGWSQNSKEILVSTYLERSTRLDVTRVLEGRAQPPSIAVQQAPGPPGTAAAVSSGVIRETRSSARVIARRERQAEEG